MVDMVDNLNMVDNVSMVDIIDMMIMQKSFCYLHLLKDTSGHGGQGRHI